MLAKIRLLFKLSIFKTIYLNVHFFGFKRLLKPIVLVGHNVSLDSVSGTIKFDENKKCRLCLGVSHDRPEFAKGKTHVFLRGGSC